MPSRIHALLTAPILLLSVTLSAEPLEWGLSYTADYLGNARGGIETSYRYLDNVDLTLSLPVAADNALGLPAGQLFGYLIYNNSNQFSPEVVGDIQVVSNIDNTYNSRVYELWYQMPLTASSSLKA